MYFSGGKRFSTWITDSLRTNFTTGNRDNGDSVDFATRIAFANFADLKLNLT